MEILLVVKVYITADLGVDQEVVEMLTQVDQEEEVILGGQEDLPNQQVVELMLLMTH